MTGLSAKQQIALASGSLNYGGGAQPFQQYGGLGSFIPPAQTPAAQRVLAPIQQQVALSPPAAAPNPSSNPYGFANSPAYMGRGSTGYPSRGLGFGNWIGSAAPTFASGAQSVGGMQAAPWVNPDIGQ